MIRSFSSILVIFTLMTATAMAQQPEDTSYQREWEQIDSLVNKGLPQSAAKIARQLLATAQQKKDGANAIKAQLFLMGIDDSIHEHADIRNIQQIDSIIANSQGAEKAIWQSINAEHYWQYFQRNRWQLYSRTPVAGPPPTDMATWDAATLIAKASELYQASILDGEPLKTVPVEHYIPILLEGKNTRHLRPTLYDFLAFRAITFFENDEKDVIKPAYQFQIDGTLWFEPAKKFSEVKVNPVDPDALHFKALHTYQQVLAFHLHDKKPDALIDADLQRLAFVHRYSVHPDKDSLYRDALQQLMHHYRDEPAAAQAHYQLLQFDYDHRTAQAKDTLNLVEIRKQLDGLIARFPESEGAINAASLRYTLTSKVLNLQTEAVVLPGENSKALISYRNLDKIYLRVYQWPTDFPNPYRHLDEAKRAQLLQRTPILSWEVSLPGVEDLYEHHTEIKIDPLPVGQYLLVGSARADFDTDSNTLHVVPWQASTLSMVTNDSEQGQQLFALHRKLGVPITDAQVSFWENRWDSKTSQYTYHAIGQTRTDENGRALISKQRDNQTISRITIATADDTLYTEGYFGTHGRWYDEQSKTATHTFLFTDRALYRPGQTIHFKGIMVTNERDGNKNKVVPNQAAEVTLYDVNNQQVASLKVTTNAYGSFAGKFNAPTGGLTGGMRIETENGQVYFSVEEYKRPKFQVAFDTPTTTTALNEEITITGRATAYAGNNIDGADVRYRVVRHARFPYLWTLYRWGMPHSPEIEITNGTVKTQPDGSFEVAFTTIPDKQISPETLPVFTYTVYADVTDVNGETQSGVQYIQAGYRTLQLHASIAEQLDVRSPQTLSVTTQNLNGATIPARVDITVAPLRFPGKLYRNRQWEKPDRHVMTEAAFRQLFPDDEYHDEANYLSWPEDDVIWSTTVNTGEQPTTELPPTLWQHDGWHIITLKTTDTKGYEITEKKYTYVVDPTRDSQPQRPLLVLAPAATLEPGDTLHMTVKTGFDHAFVWESNTDIQPGFTTFTDIRHTDRSITQQDRGGLGFSWLFVHNNRVYMESKHVAVPWSDRDLQLEWATHRDKLLPGEAEEWRLTIKGNKKDAVAAELLAGLYDASLDALKPHGWYWNRLSPTNYPSVYWQANAGFGTASSVTWLHSINGRAPQGYEKRYDHLFGYGYTTMQFGTGIQVRGMAQKAAPAMQADAVFESAEVGERYEKEDSAAPTPLPVNEETQTGSGNEAAIETADVIPVRTNLQETAFFFPQLHTDADGNVTVKFTMPEALTEWKLMAFAHTQDWKTGYLEGKVKTQKDLMVMPNLPRFLRQGDRIHISTKISNLAEQTLQGVARLEILDATTLIPITDAFGNSEHEVAFTVDQSQSTSVAWPIHIPSEHYEPVVIRISAKAGDFTDGEEHTLPVITNRMLVTETLPLPVRGNESKAFTLPKLLQPESNTLSHHALTVEFTGNPAWYAVQALPYLMEYPYECAEQVFNRFYANALAAHIVDQAPKVKAIFDQWLESDTAALLSNLEKNQELKSALLEETPWVMEAKNESEQKRRIALLFDGHKLAQGLQQNLNKLAEMQLSEGGFPWFKGMQSNRYITQYIVTGIVRLQQLGVNAANTDAATQLVDQALAYLDRQIKSDYDQLLTNKANLDNQQIGHSQVQYLYMRSFLVNKSIPEASRTAVDYYKNQASKYWTTFNPYLQGQVALALHRLDHAQTPADIIASLRETAIQSEEMGMYWKSMPHSYWWYEAPIEAQALLIEAFAEITEDAKTVDALKVWLLKQKQTQHWKTTKATADAIYALLLRGNDWLTNEPVVSITLGAETIRSTDVKTEAGTGYFKKRYEGEAISTDMGNITVQVDQAKNEGVAWGAVYWQYFEDLDKISGAETPLSLRKQLYIERNTDRGPVLTEITDGNMLKIGDKVKIRIELRVDRDMEYVHLKDMRAACFEPTNVLSGYRYQGGLGYYESTRDVATNFFFDYLRKGTYVFEYPVFVSQAGDFSNGIATIQSMYAPEFSSHSEGIRVKVE